MSVSQHKNVKSKDALLIRETQSVCPVCLKRLSAKIVEENNEVFLEKTCPSHGFFRELYWSDAKIMKKFNQFEINGIMPKYAKANSKNSYPINSNLYNKHETQTLLAIIDLTNRCNLRCNYCFANAEVAGYVYEPKFEEIEEMMDVLKSQKPLPVLALMFSGGEPTLRTDLVELVKKANEKGFTQVFIATNGIEIAKNPKLAKELQNAGVTTLYLKFNGVTPETSPENYKFMPKIIENCRKAGLQITLVPTMIKGFNDHEAYSIIQFALKNLDVIRGVNFQPVSFCGSMSPNKRKEKRLTIPELAKILEKQSNGLFGADSFYPIPSAGTLSALAEKLTGEKQYTFSVHPNCGAATYLFKDGDKVFPITNFVNVDTAFKEINELSKEPIHGKISKLLVVNKLRKILKRNIIQEKVPSNLKLNKLLFELLTGNFSTLPVFHMQTLFVGAMHFQDVYNLDVERVKKCGVHYITPDNKIIPFCSYNVLGYRKKFEETYVQKLKSGDSK